MFEFLRRLFIGHSHKWEIKDTIMVGDGSGGYAGKIVVMQCEVCGALKNHKIKW